MNGPGGEPRIAIVDDQEPNRRLLERVLGRAGFADVQSFVDGAAFLEALDAFGPDIVLLDLHMPAMDGFAVLDAIRERQEDGDYLPVLVLTADAERRARSRALENGANDFLLKPFDPEEVVLRVRNLLATRSLHRALQGRNSELMGEVVSTTERLAASEAEWADVAAALGRLQALESAERTAVAICRELVRLPDLTTVAICAFAGRGSMVPLAIEGPVSARFAVNGPLSDLWSDRFYALVRDGAWIGSMATLAEDLGLPEILEEQATSAALVPFGPDGAPIGFLAAGTQDPGGLGTLAPHLHSLEAFAALTGALLGPGMAAHRDHDEAARTLEGIIGTRAFIPVFQPIVALATDQVVGYEALTRFADGMRPDRRFADATAMGFGPTLEAVTLQAAVEAARRLPAQAWVSLNVSPEIVLAGKPLRDIVASADRNLVFELTEHVPIEDYQALKQAVASLSPAVRFAIDDAGAGFASMRHILELRPDFVKLDIGLIRGIEQDPARQAFVAGMAYFAVKTGCELIGEGIETDAERRQLEQLAIGIGQGYLLGRPAEAPATPARAASPPLPRRASGEPVASGHLQPTRAARPVGQQRSGDARHRS